MLSEVWAPLVTDQVGSVVACVLPPTMATKTRSFPTVGVAFWRRSAPAVIAAPAAQAVTAVQATLSQYQAEGPRFATLLPLTGADRRRRALRGRQAINPQRLHLNQRHAEQRLELRIRQRSQEIPQHDRILPRGVPVCLA